MDAGLRNRSGRNNLGSSSALPSVVPTHHVPSFRLPTLRPRSRKLAEAVFPNRIGSSVFAKFNKIPLSTSKDAGVSCLTHANGEVLIFDLSDDRYHNIDILNLLRSTRDALDRLRETTPQGHTFVKRWWGIRGVISKIRVSKC